MMMANAAISAALWAGAMAWSQIADAMSPNAKPATPATRAPVKQALTKMMISSGAALDILGPQLLQLPNVACSFCQQPVSKRRDLRQRRGGLGTNDPVGL